MGCAEPYEPGENTRQFGREPPDALYNADAVEYSDADLPVLLVPRDEFETAEKIFDSHAVSAVTGPLTPIDLLKGRLVVIWPQDQAEQLAARLKAAAAAEIRMVQFSEDWPADWTIRRGAGDPQMRPLLRELLDEAQPWKPSTNKRKTTPDAQDENGPADETMGAEETLDQDTTPQTIFSTVERVDLHDVDGLLADLRDEIVATTPRFINRNLALGASISILSTLCGRQIASPTNCSLNLYLLAIAPTGAGKEHPLQSVGRFLRAAGFGYLTCGTFASASALELLLLEKPCLTAIIDEVGNSLFARMSNKRASTHEASLGGLLRTLWSKNFGTYETVATVIRNGKQEIPAPHLSIFGAGTAPEFYGSLGAHDVTNGMFNRLTILKASPRERKTSTSENVYREPPQELLNRLRAIVPDEPVFMKQHVVSPRVIPWASPDVAAAFEAFEDEVFAKLDMDAELQPYVSRVAEQGARLMTIRAVSRDGRSARVTMEDLKWGLSFAASSAEFAICDIRENVSASGFEAKAKLVKKCLDGLWRISAEVSQTALNKSIKERLKPQEIREVIESLEGAGYLRVNKQKTKGRRRITYSKIEN